jgi:hypothetical protein
METWRWRASLSGTCPRTSAPFLTTPVLLRRPVEAIRLRSGGSINNTSAWFMVSFWQKSRTRMRTTSFRRCSCSPCAGYRICATSSFEAWLSANACNLANDHCRSLKPMDPLRQDLPETVGQNATRQFGRSIAVDNRDKFSRQVA